MQLSKHYSTSKALYDYYKFRQNERLFNVKLNIGAFYVIRLDGKGMTRSFRANKDLFFHVMKSCFHRFCSDSFLQDTLKKFICAYSFSDEVSILFRHSDDRNRSQKILTLLASKLSVLFYRVANELGLDLREQDWLFDARILEIKRHESVNYFIARQSFAIDRYLLTFREQDIHHSLAIDMQDMSEYMLGLLYVLGEYIEIFEFSAEPERFKKLLHL